MDRVKKSLTVALKTEVGMLPGQTLADFSAEVRALGPEDREWYKRAFAEAGIDIVEKTDAKADAKA